MDIKQISLEAGSVNSQNFENENVSDAAPVVSKRRSINLTTYINYIKKLTSVFTTSFSYLTKFLKSVKLIDRIKSVKFALSRLIKRRSKSYDQIPNQNTIMPKDRFRKLNKKAVLKGAFFVVALVLVIFLVRGVSKFKGFTGKSGLNSSDVRPEVAGAKSSMELNREFSFPLKTAKGVEVSRFKYILQNAELRDEILVKGQKATAIKGKTFLVVNLKISNEFNQASKINSKDYIRLSVNGNKDEWLAPEYHNDPVEVQAQSTKYTRIGFPISDNDGNLLLRVGEIDGSKEEVSVSFN